MLHCRLAPEALLNTGSLAGDFIASRTVKELQLDPFILTDRSKLVCSGLENSSYDESSYIALLVSYFSKTLNKYVAIELKATISNSSPIDLVIGRDSIRKYNLFSEVPSQLASPVTASTVKLGSVPTCCQATGSPCGCQPKRRSLLQNGSPMGRSASIPNTWYAGRTCRHVRQPAYEAAADVDEIWRRRTPFCRGRPLSKLHIFGDGDQRKQILALCEEFRGIFSNELDETPALVPPFDLKVDDTKWKVRANRAPPRPQTPANQADMVK
jgi:hypothetical protein